LRKNFRFFLIFLLFFTALLKTTGKLLLLLTNKIHFPIRKDTAEENLIIFTVLKSKK